MKLILIPLAALFTFLPQAYSLDVVPGEYIIRYKNSNSGVGALGKTALEHNMQLRKSWSGMNLHHFKVRDVDRDDVANTLRSLKDDPDVLFAEPNYYVTASDLPYAMTAAPIRAPESWALATPNGPGVVTPVVAVLDSGLDITHPVFSGTGRLWENTAELNGVVGVDDDGNGYIDDINGWNFISNDNDLTDNSGHGTHVSGIVVGSTENIFTMTGNERVKVMPLKFLDANGIGTTAAAVNAIYYAVDQGAKVLNNSWGGSDYSVSLHEAITYSYNQGTLFVAAAGNSSNNNDNSPTFPANYDVPNVVSVGASTDGDGLASFSNFGSETVDLLAPGVSIYSTIPGGGFGLSTGTSMSTPFVSGLASMIVREAPQFSGFQIKETILDSVDAASGASGVTLTAGRSAFENTVGNSQANKSNPTFQPDYTPDYNYSSRSLASTEAGAGCGRVREVYKDKFGSYKNNTQASLLQKVLAAFLLLLPVLVAFVARLSSTGRIRRKYKRVKVNLIGDLYFAGINIPVAVEDISAGGAGVSLKNSKLNKFFSKTEEEPVTLKVYKKDKAAAQYPCKIVRNSNGKLGLKF